MKEQLLEHSRKLARQLRDIEFSHEALSHVYNPLQYAWDGYRQYVETYLPAQCRVYFLGMNPGPFGMTQTGVPFGEIAAVRDYLKLAPRLIASERPIHAKRPLEGMDCKRSEVSGKRLWGLFASHYPQARDFFKQHWVSNFCPLLFLSNSGSNIVPEKLQQPGRRQLEELCQKHLLFELQLLKPHYLVGVGKFAEQQLEKVRPLLAHDCVLGSIIHPSPASPLGNKNWPQLPLQQLEQLGVWPSC